MDIARCFDRIFEQLPRILSLSAAFITSRWVAALPGSEFNLNYGLASVLGIVIGDLMP
jgi:hypothetical protein